MSKHPAFDLEVDPPEEGDFGDEHAAEYEVETELEDTPDD